ncbi:hypothetical protein ACFVZD_43830 [Streptomyces sp. NPDC058287]|uniref:hypothetical protein n=1 Tax=unclassified Streptomyces TaxID=2593676 RepID=UPI0036EAD699
MTDRRLDGRSVLALVTNYGVEQDELLVYVCVTNSTAFSPTDTMPLATRAKLLMSVQSIATLLTSLLVMFCTGCPRRTQATDQGHLYPRRRPVPPHQRARRVLKG